MTTCQYVSDRGSKCKRKAVTSYRHKALCNQHLQEIRYRKEVTDVEAEE